jgi:hypothetical protein
LKGDMLIDAKSPTAVSTGVTGAISQAAQLTGTNFRYLLAAAKVESNLNPQAAAKTSSAGGLFQFIEQTWLGTLKEAGSSLGYGRYANAIERNSSGRFVVTDPSLRSEILNLRKDPSANAAMAGAFTKSNAAYLTQKLGRAPTDGELYMAHFLGAGGAAKLINLAAAMPNATAADAFPRAAGANRSIFYTQEGRPRSLADVARNLTGRYEVALAGTAPLVAGLARPSAPIAETTRVARVYEAATPMAASPMPTPRMAANEDSQYQFRNPYRAARKVAMAVTPPTIAAPVPAAAPAVSPTQVAPVAPPSAAGNEPLGLFQDMKPNVRALFTGT